MAAVLFTGGPGGPFGMDLFDHLGWFYDGGGQELFQEWYQKVIQRDVVAFPIVPFAPQMFGWFKHALQGLGRSQGPPVPGGGHERADPEGRRRGGGQHRGRRDLPAAERGAIDAAEWCCPAEDIKLGFQRSGSTTTCRACTSMTEAGDLVINKKVWDKLAPDLQELVKIRPPRSTCAGGSSTCNDNAKGLDELRTRR